MKARINEAYHELIDDLAERKFFGELTFYFQGGKIESNRTSERNTRSEIGEKMQAKSRRKVITAPLPLSSLHS